MLLKTDLIGKHLRLVFVLLLAIAPATSNADVFSILEPTPLTQHWVNIGSYTYHFQKQHGLNNSNVGLGMEVRYSNVNSVTFGTYQNSTNRTSHYIGWYWQPIGIGPFRVGASLGAMDGYPHRHDNQWFPALIPTASWEYKYIGANLVFIPSYRDRQHGLISCQIKFKIF
jgi:hypothetical protein